VAAPTPARIVGCLVGGAIGDAWGFPHEGSIEVPSPGSGPVGGVSDETELMVATCEAIVRRGQVDPAEIAARMLARFQRRAIAGLGASTLQALRNLDARAHWALAGARGDRAAGNGPATRIAPLAFLLDPNQRADRERIREVCRITHHHEQAYAGALAMVWAVRWAAELDGDAARVPLLSFVASRLPDSAVRDRLCALEALDRRFTPRAVAERFGASGYVGESVPLALFAAQDARDRDFADVVRSAVEAGGDCDSIGSMAGQIAGAALGVQSIPTALREPIEDIAGIERSATTFAELVAPRRAHSTVPAVNERP